MAKIAAADNAAMNQLFAEEMKTAGIKVAGEDLQAFADHKSYTETLESALKTTNSWAPNDPVLD